MAAPPVLPGDLVEEILLRLPPDDPACLLRASVVCKTWGCAVSHPSFRRRIHEHHRTPPVLGFLHDGRDEHMPSFVPTTASAFSLAAPDCRFWRALDCRHGRALFLSKSLDTAELLLWEPITGALQRVLVPAPFKSMYPKVILYSSAAVFCAADGCNHQGCHGGPFHVVFVFSVDKCTGYDEYVTSVCVYSSETGTWAELTNGGVTLEYDCEFLMDFGEFSSVLVGKSLLYFMSNGGVILEYDLARNNLTMIDRPDSHFVERFNFMLAEDGGLGLIQDSDPHIKLWSREASDSTDAQWVLSRVIYLGNFLPDGALVNAENNLFVLCFAEGVNVIFIDTIVGIFTVELPSERVRKVCGNNGICKLIPVVSFYTPVAQNKHQNQLLLNASEKKRGNEEKTVDQAEQLFDNGPNAIKEGTSSTRSNVLAMSSLYLDYSLGHEGVDLRRLHQLLLFEGVPAYGDDDPESTDMGALPLYEAWEMIDSLGDLPKTA